MNRNNQQKRDSVELADKLLSGAVQKKYQGKQLVIIAGKMFILPEDDTKAAKLVNRLEQKYPDEIPHLVSVPRPETYAL